MTFVQAVLKEIPNRFCYVRSIILLVNLCDVVLPSHIHVQIEYYVVNRIMAARTHREPNACLSSR